MMGLDKLFFLCLYKKALAVQTIKQEARLVSFRFIIQMKADQGLTDTNSKFK